MSAQLWSDPTVVPVTEMHPNLKHDPALQDFYDDVCARLAEIADKQRALRYRFPDLKTADRYRNYVRRHAQADGHNLRSLIRKTDDGGVHLHFAYRAAKPAPELKKAPPSTPPLSANANGTRKPEPQPAPPPPPARETSAWVATLRVDGDLAQVVRELDTGAAKWRTLDNDTRRPLVRSLIAYLKRNGLALTQDDFNKYRPGFMPTAWGACQNLNYSSWTKLITELEQELDELQ